MKYFFYDFKNDGKKKYNPKFLVQIESENIVGAIKDFETQTKLKFAGFTGLTIGEPLNAKN